MKKQLIKFSSLVFIFLVLSCGTDEKKTDSKRKSVSKIEAKVVAEGQIESNLKSPSTAEFSNLRDTKMEKFGNGYLVKGYVDSENSFGANIRTYYSVEITVDTISGEIMYSNLKME